MVFSGARPNMDEAVKVLRDNQKEVMNAIVSTTTSHSVTASRVGYQDRLASQNSAQQANSGNNYRPNLRTS